jgi:hypothetical protein
LASLALCWALALIRVDSYKTSNFRDLGSLVPLGPLASLALCWVTISGRVAVVWAPLSLSRNKTSLNYNHFWSCGGRLGPLLPSPNKTSLTYNHFWSCGGRLGPPPFQKSPGHPRKAQDTPRKPRTDQESLGQLRKAQEVEGWEQEGMERGGVVIFL